MSDTITDPATDQAATGPMTPTLVIVDPTELAAHPLNVRDSVDVADLLPSIRENGVLQPPVIATADGSGWRIVAGHRRIAAAIEAGLTKVACVVREDLATDTEAVIGMVNENVHRRDLGDLEVARAYQTLLDLGLSRTKIAKRTGSKSAHVKDALAVVAHPVAAEAAAAGLTLLQSLAIAEFEDNPDAADQLYDAALYGGAGEFDHLLSRLRQDRADAAKRIEAQAALADTGVRVITDDDRDEWPNATRLSNLTNDTEAHAPIKPEDHTDCPGHAAGLDQWNDDKVHYFCTDPDAYGHHGRYPTFDGTRRTGPMTDDEKAERRTVVENNKAWKAAEPVRREWLRNLLQSKKPPKGLLRWCVAEVSRTPGSYHNQANDGLVADLLGVTAAKGTWGRDVIAAKVEESTDVALPLVLLAYLAADREHHMDAETQAGRMTWRKARDEAARYLVQLREMGYPLSAVEQLAVEQVYPPVVETDSGPEADDGHKAAESDHDDDDADDRPVLTVIPGGDGDDRADTTANEDGTATDGQAQPTPKTFEVGRSYCIHWATDHTLRPLVTVTQRTARFVTIEDEYGDTKRCGVTVVEGEEIAYPDGRYSMCPVLRASNVVDTTADEDEGEGEAVEDGQAQPGADESAGVEGGGRADTA